MRSYPHLHQQVYADTRQARMSGTETGQGPQRLEISLLSQIVGQAWPREVGDEAPHVGLGGADELGKGVGVASGGHSSQPHGLVVLGHGLLALLVET